MVYLSVSDLEHAYGSQRVLENVSFAIGEGERLCLLGPSGCGKTTTLQVLAGFVKPHRGNVELSGTRIDDLPPEKRNIGIMFQNYALFPHMSVFENVAFGLRMRRIARDEINARVSEALRLVRLPHAAAKTPSQLSGGEQQRIAFARAIVIKPSLLLLDEPFSNLDARLRVEMRTELLELLQSLSVATVMVTHDQEEAMAIADRIAVMYRGQIEQIGTTKEIYDHPASLFVGQFVGSSNVFPGHVLGSDMNGIRVDADALGHLYARTGAGSVDGNRVQVMVRPERISISPNAGTNEDGFNCVRGIVEQAVFLGHRTEWTVRSGRSQLTVWHNQDLRAEAAPGREVTLKWRVDDTVLVPEEVRV